ncbi:MAG: hypothetical protein PUD51_10485 [Prevotellaceae bacterium]|nr:hypothetical protein [Prevotellaceae bacterium]
MIVIVTKGNINQEVKKQMEKKEMAQRIVELMLKRITQSIDK